MGYGCSTGVVVTLWLGTSRSVWEAFGRTTPRSGAAFCRTASRFLVANRRSRAPHGNKALQQHSDLAFAVGCLSRARASQAFAKRNPASARPRRRTVEALGREGLAGWPAVVEPLLRCVRLPRHAATTAIRSQSLDGGGARRLCPSRRGNRECSKEWRFVHLESKTAVSWRRWNQPDGSTLLGTSASSAPTDQPKKLGSTKIEEVDRE